MTIITTRPEAGRTPSRRAFTLVELMVAATLGAMIVMAVLGSQLHLIRNGIQVTRHAEMEAQVRKGLEQFGNDLRCATDVAWNGASDITLTVPALDDTTSQVTYAWDDSSESFYRVPGASSSSTTGRVILIRHIPAQTDGSPGLSFARYDSNNNAATSDQTTKRIQVSLTVVRDTPPALPPVSFSASTGYILRNKLSL